MESKAELQGANEILQQAHSSQTQCEVTTLTSECPTTTRSGSTLGSLKAHYRKLRTLKGTARTLINLSRASVNTVKMSALPASNSNEAQRSVALEVPRISDTTTSTVQSQVQELVAKGHVITEIDPTSDVNVTYRRQGNLDLYTEINLAKRVSLQQHPHMIALTQRLWNCALHNGEKELKFADYETYMLCLHRLILPDFDMTSSKELIMDDWKRDTGEQDHLDYAFFHLSMFECVDLWTDTVEPEDYISLLYCITHCLTYLLNDRHILKLPEEISTVDILKESKEVTLEEIKQDLQREINSDVFPYYRDQVLHAAQAKQNAEQGANELQSLVNELQVHQDSETSSKFRRDSQIQPGGTQTSSTTKRESQSHQVLSRPRERDSLLSSSRGRDGNAAKDLEAASQRRQSRTDNSVSRHDSPKRKFSIHSGTSSLSLTANTFGSDRDNTGSILPSSTQNFAAESSPVSPTRKPTLQRVLSPNIFNRSGGVIINVGKMDGEVVLKVPTDGKSAATPSTAASPRRRSRETSTSSLRRQEPIAQADSDKVDGTREASQSSGLQVDHTEAAKSALQPGAHDPNASSHVATPVGPGTDKSRAFFRFRSAAVAEAAASMVAHIHHRKVSSRQRTQQRLLQTGTTRPIAPNIYLDNSSLTAPLVMIISSKAPTSHKPMPSTSKIQLHLHKSPDLDPVRPQSPHDFLMGTAISSPRANNAVNAQAREASVSPRSPIPRRPGSILDTEHQTSTIQRKVQQEENRVPVAASPSSNPANTAPLTVNGTPAVPNAYTDALSAKFESSRLLLTPSGALDGVTPASNSKDDGKDLVSLRYIATSPLVSHSPAHLLSNLQQSSAQRQKSPRARHHLSTLALESTPSHPRQQRHVRHLYELQ